MLAWLRMGLVAGLATVAGLGSFEGRAAGQAPDRLGLALDSLVAAEMDRNSVVGIVVGVVRGKDTLALRGWGHADLEHRVAMTPDALFQIASITKQFTAAAVLRLADEGHLELDHQPGRYLPDFPAAAGRIRIKHLLNHTSGLPDTYDLLAWEEGLRSGRPSLEEARSELTALLSREELLFPPGTGRHYSNAGYDLLGDLIATVSGRPYGEYLEDAFFTPLDLERTGFCGWREVLAGRARGYETEEGRPVNAFRISPAYLYASGGLCSTARDLLRWNEVLHSGELLSAEAYGRMTTPEGSAATGGYGLMVGSVEGRRVLKHNGWIPGFSAQLDHYPDDSLSVVVLANSAAAVGGLAEDIARQILGLGSRPVARPPEGWRVASLGGPAARDSIHFRVMGAGLHATSGPGAFYFHADSAASGPYAVGATFIPVAEPESREGFGIVVAGQELGSDSATYILFRVRLDGSYAVERRIGERVRSLVPWTRHDAVATEARNRGRNELEARAGPEGLTLLANGVEVATLAPGEAGGVDGVGGLFVGRGHDVHIAGFGVHRSP